MTEEDVDSNKKGLILFGRNVEEIPCYRRTFLTSISSGLVGMMGYFLFTSKMRDAAKFGMATFTGVTISYWFYCRYNYSKQKFEYVRLQETLKRYQLRDVVKPSDEAEE